MSHSLSVSQLLRVAPQSAPRIIIVIQDQARGGTVRCMQLYAPPDFVRTRFDMRELRERRVGRVIPHRFAERATVRRSMESASAKSHLVALGCS